MLYFILKALFVLKLFLIFYPVFLSHVVKRLSKFMTPHKLGNKQLQQRVPDISKSKSNQTIKIDQFI